MVMATAFAPGKCILFGEHAVVYGHPAVAVAIDAGVEVKLEISEKWEIKNDYYNNNFEDFQPSKNPHIEHIIRNIFDYNGPPLKIEIESNLFSSAGLGSSAALSNAMGAALHNLTKPDDEINLIKLAKIGHSAEASAQEGRASPTDSATSSLGGCVVISGEKDENLNHIFDTRLLTPEGDRKWSIHSVDLHQNIKDSWLVLGFTGRAAPTGDMVSGVAEKLRQKPELYTEMQAIENITKAGLTALELGNLEAVGIAMNSCHEKLKILGVSSDLLDNMVLATRHHSFGSKLTGAGGGGCMVALTNDPQRVAQEIELCGGQPLISKFGSKGAHIKKE
jgi:mevalonate kinase